MTAPKLKDMVDYFTFLDKLRASSITNMFDAAQYLEEMFNTSRVGSKRILLLWMESFSDESPEDRAAAALNKWDSK